MFYPHDFSFFGQKLNWLVQISDIQTFIQELLFTEKVVILNLQQCTYGILSYPLGSLL